MPGMQEVDSLQRVLDSVFAAPVYHWVRRPDPLAIVRRFWEALKLWFFTMDQRFPGFTKVSAVILLTLVAAILVHVTWLVIRTMKAAPVAAAEPGREVLRGADWYQAEAERLAQRGDYIAAMQTHFLALVLKLDQRGVLRYQASKTPAEYLREVSLPQEEKRRFSALVSSLYGFAFAGWPCDAAKWRDWKLRAAPELYVAQG